MIVSNMSSFACAVTVLYIFTLSEDLYKVLESKHFPHTTVRIIVYLRDGYFVDKTLSNSAASSISLLITVYFPLCSL